MSFFNKSLIKNSNNKDYEKLMCKNKIWKRSKLGVSAQTTNENITMSPVNQAVNLPLNRSVEINYLLMPVIK